MDVVDYCVQRYVPWNWITWCPGSTDNWCGHLRSGIWFSFDLDKLAWSSIQRDHYAPLTMVSLLATVDYSKIGSRKSSATCEWLPPVVIPATLEWLPPVVIPATREWLPPVVIPATREWLPPVVIPCSICSLQVDLTAKVVTECGKTKTKQVFGKTLPLKETMIADKTSFMRWFNPKGSLFLKMCQLERKMLISNGCSAHRH